jgi:hypothetical protein
MVPKKPKTDDMQEIELKFEFSKTSEKQEE